MLAKILFENKKAVGVECLNKNGELITIKASKEVILSSEPLVHHKYC